MFQWIKEMYPFLEVNMSAMMDKYSINNALQVGYEYPATMEMRNNLQKLEDTFARQ